MAFDFPYFYSYPPYFTCADVKRIYLDHFITAWQCKLPLSFAYTQATAGSGDQG
jgi:hypothetical protein